jgi:hypothetical protein
MPYPYSPPPGTIQAPPLPPDSLNDDPILEDIETGAAQLLSTAAPSGLPDPNSTAQDGWNSGSQEGNPYDGSVTSGSLAPPAGTDIKSYTASDSGGANSNAYTTGRDINPLADNSDFTPKSATPSMSDASSFTPTNSPTGNANSFNMEDDVANTPVVPTGRTLTITNSDGYTTTYEYPGPGSQPTPAPTPPSLPPVPPANTSQTPASDAQPATPTPPDPSRGDALLAVANEVVSFLANFFGPAAVGPFLNPQTAPSTTQPPPQTAPSTTQPPPETTASPAQPRPSTEDFLYSELEDDNYSGPALNRLLNYYDSKMAFWERRTALARSAALFTASKGQFRQYELPSAVWNFSLGALNWWGGATILGDTPWETARNETVGMLLGGGLKALSSFSKAASLSGAVGAVAARGGSTALGPELPSLPSPGEPASVDLDVARQLGFDRPPNTRPWFNAGFGKIQVPKGQTYSQVVNNAVSALDPSGSTITQTLGGEYGDALNIQDKLFWQGGSSDFAFDAAMTGKADVLLGNVPSPTSQWAAIERPTLRFFGAQLTVHLRVIP